METLEITHLDGEAGLRLVGELDLSSAQQLKEALSAVRGSGQVQLDVSELTFIDSSGLHAIVECARSQNGRGPLIVKGASAAMLRLFEITGIAELPSVEIREP